jgi:hypothetical protein
MKFTTLNRADCTRFRNEVLPAINAALSGFGLVIDMPGSIAFTGTQLSTKINISLLDDSAVKNIVAQREARYKLGAKMLGLPEDGFGKMFTFRKNVYRVVGLPEGRSSNVDIEAVATGRLYRLDAPSVATALKINPVG